MIKDKLGNTLSRVILVLGLFASSVCSAQCGGWYGRPVGFLGGLGFWGPNVVIGVGSGYDPICRTVPVCNRKGYCWLVDECY
jgi:hypothetical protein